MLALLLMTTVSAVSTAIAIHYYKLSQSLMRCSVFGCLTRQGIERRRPKHGSVLVFLDIDDMKGENSRHGYEEVNRRIAASLANVRAADARTIAGRLFSGDELVFFADGTNGTPVCDRITAAFATNGLGVTMAWIKADATKSLTEQTTPLSAEVLRKKQKK